LSEDQLYDPIRKIFIKSLPEEIVRQKLLKKMVANLGYPKSLIAIEKDIDKLTHIDEKIISKRRADIICFAKNIHPKHSIYPLLMIECKAYKLDQKTIDQVLGYNHLIKAFFVAIASKNVIKTFWYDGNLQSYESVDFLPKYKDLIEMVRYAKNR
jgi:Type I restriction enzyme R protein N terminus (HSDR_N)